MLEVGPKCSTSHSDTQTNFATHVRQIQTKNSKLTRGHANNQCLQLIAQHVSPLWFFSALYKNLWLQMVLIKIFSPFSPAMSHPLCVLLRDLNLKRPIYQQTASYGHFGRPEFSWEVPKKLVL